MNSINENSQAPGINGKTIDAGRELVERMLSIFTLSRVDPGRAGVIRFISTTYAAWRRAISGVPIARRFWAPSGENAVGGHPPYWRATAL